MIAAFDIGNSAIKFAVFEREAVREADREAGRTADRGAGREAAVNGEVAGAGRGARVVRAGRLIDTPRDTASALDESVREATAGLAITAVGCVSVVPHATRVLDAAVSSVLGEQLVVLTTSSPTPLKMGYQTPETLGVDRLAAAVAAFELYGTRPDGERRAVLAIDAGTTTTFEVVSAAGVYLGGTIGPGPGMMRTALNAGTAQLPVVDMDEPLSPIGSSTREAIQSGVMYGYLGGVERLIEQLKAEVEGEPAIVATGGWARWLADRIPVVGAVDEHLVLRGAMRMLISGSHIDPRREH